jgi:hypothetical protein
MYFLTGAATLNNSTMFEDCRPPPLLKPHETAIVDSVCTDRFSVGQRALFEQNSISKSFDCLPPKQLHHGVNSYSNIRHTLIKQGCIHFTYFSGIASHSLLSVGKLCNQGYSVTFKIDAVTIYNPQDVQILKGARYLDTGLWRHNLRREHQQHLHEVANKVYELCNT